MVGIGLEEGGELTLREDDGLDELLLRQSDRLLDLHVDIGHTGSQRLPRDVVDRLQLSGWHER